MPEKRNSYDSCPLPNFFLSIEVNLNKIDFNITLKKKDVYKFHIVSKYLRINQMRK